MKKLILTALPLFSFLFCEHLFAWSYNLDIVEFGEVDSMYRIQQNTDYAVFGRQEAAIFQGVYGYDISNEEEFLITESHPNYPPRLSPGSNFCIWTEMSDINLHGYNLDTRQGFTIPEPNGIYMDSARIDGQYIVYKNNDIPTGKLKGYDIVTKQEFLITANDVYYYNMDRTFLAGNYLIYYDMMSMWLYGYQMSTRSDFLITSNMVDTMNLQNNGRFAVWTETGPPTTLKGFDLSSKNEFVIASDFTTTGSITLSRENDYLVWVEGTMPYELHIYELNTKQETIIEQSYIDTMFLGNNGRYVVWKGDNSGGAIYKLYGYDLANQEQFLISPHDVFTHNISMADSSDYLVYKYMDSMTMNHYFYGYDLANRNEFLIDNMDAQYANIEGDFVTWQTMSPNTSWYGGRIYSVMNDVCGDALDVQSGQHYNGTTTGALGSDISSCTYNDVADVWYRFGPTAGGEYTINVESGSFDTALSLYQACGGDELSCNDDYNLQSTNSQITVDLVKGKDYYIRVSGFDGQSGDFDLFIMDGSCSGPIASDLNSDCKVDMSDLAVFVSEWLSCNIVPTNNCWQ